MATDKKNENKTTKTTVEFEYEGKEYKLEYTAASLKKMEERGFDILACENKPLQYPEEIFCGAFIANHDSVPYDKRMEIYHELGETAEEGENILEIFNLMVVEAVNEIRTHKGNVKWKVKK